VRRRQALLLGLALPLAAASPAAAAEVEIKAVDSTETTPAGWDKPLVTIAPGDTVVWSFAGTAELHNVLSASENWSYRSGEAVKAGPNGSFPFTTTGRYDFVCQVHAEMRGTVTVGDVPPPPPPPLSEQPFPNDGAAPTVLETGGLDTTKPTLRSVRVQRMKRGARIRFRVSERARVTVRFKRAGKVVRTRHVDAAGTARLAVRGKALRAGRYRVELRAEDIAGNRSGLRTARLTVR
jgi:plastocyanin